MRKNTHTHTYTPNENDAKALKLTEYRSMFTMERAVDSWIVHFSSHDKWCECCWFCSPFFFYFFFLSSSSISFCSPVFSSLERWSSDFPMLTWKSVNVVIIDRKHFPQHRKLFTQQKHCVVFTMKKEKEKKRNPIWSLKTTLESLYWYRHFFPLFSTMIEVWLANFFPSFSMRSFIYVSGENCLQSLTSKQEVFSREKKIKQRKIR